MKTLIIYDSVFGNTEQVAQAIGRAVGAADEVKVVRVGDVTPDDLAGARLLIAGSPTRGFRPTPALQKFLAGLPQGSLTGIKVAAFDTRIALSDVDSRILPIFVRLFGYAAQPIADRLAKKGGALCLPPEGFLVKGSEGPLKDGELDRAADWARRILAAG